MYDFQVEMQKIIAETEKHASESLARLDTNPDLAEAVRYAFFAGGKRIRPVFVTAFFNLCGGTDRVQALETALAIECVHTYSLIHDDLPGMDNDDYRRGRPTLHKRNNEATAILAGDGLLTLAFEKLSNVTPATLAVRLIGNLAQSAGFSGMVGGQFCDMFPETLDDLTPENRIDRIQSLKTGALLEVACIAGAMCANANQEKLNAARQYGARAGRAFQIRDDLLDVLGNSKETGKAVNKDERQGKFTYIQLYGIENTVERLKSEIIQAKQALEIFPADQRKFLEELAEYIGERAV